MFERVVDGREALGKLSVQGRFYDWFNDKLLYQYIEWIANRRMKSIGLKPSMSIAAKNNPLPWTEHWIF